MKKIFALLHLILITSLLFAQAKLESASQQTSATNTVRICQKDLVWTDAKPPLKPGAKIALMEGNPKTSGHFTIRMKFPPYYKIDAHTHPVDERTTVISGAMYIGLGRTVDT